MAEQFHEEVTFYDSTPMLVGRNRGKLHPVRNGDCLGPVFTDNGVHFESVVPDTPEGIESVIPAPPKGASLVEAAEFMQGLNLLSLALKDQEGSQ